MISISVKSFLFVTVENTGTCVPIFLSSPTIKLIFQQAVKTPILTLNDIKIERTITKISVRENFAEAELDVRVIASEGEHRGYIIGDAGQAAAIKIFFEKSSYKWLITKVEGVFEKGRGAF
jgi:hypothetical protein